MAYQNVKRRMADHLQPRATTAKASASKTITQPTNVIALTTTFTPPSSCFDNKLTMLPPPKFFIWANEPVPVANTTVAACYPSEFLESYTSIASGIGSSVVPAMSPLVCPKNYCTQFAEEKNYIACCPSGYLFHPPDTTVLTDRPAYGGVCYSDFTTSTDYPVVAYNETGDTASQAFRASTMGDQAFAHVIDGWALTSPSIIGCPTPSSSLASSSLISSSIISSVSSASVAVGSAAAAPTESKPMSSGAIAGAVVGSIIGLAAIIAFVWFILAYYRKHRQGPPPPPKVHHMGDDFAQPKDTVYYRHEAEAGYQGNEIGSSAWGNEKGGANTHVAHEMDAHAPVELDSGAAVKYGGMPMKGGKV